MEVIYDDDNNPTVYLSRRDECFDCSNQYGCPLIECLGSELVKYVEEIEVVDCQHYKD